MEFKKGQRVYRKVTDKYGTITGKSKVFGAKKLWEVDFDGDYEFVPEKQLVPANESGSPEQLFKARMFDDFQSFRQYLTHVRWLQNSISLMWASPTICCTGKISSEEQPNMDTLLSILSFKNLLPILIIRNRRKNFHFGTH